LDQLKGVDIGSPTIVGAFTAFPLLAREQRSPGYITLDEALDEHVAAVTEVSEAGSVGQLRVTNGGKRPVLILDGEELVGAKQNRIVNLTILVASESTLEISSDLCRSWAMATSFAHVRGRRSGPLRFSPRYEAVSSQLFDGEGWQSSSRPTGGVGGYGDLCELCESRHQVGETLNTEHGWILVERIDDFLEILVDNFAPEASSRLRRPRRTRGVCESTRQPWGSNKCGLGVVAPLEFLPHCLSDIGHRHRLGRPTRYPVG